jgi:hypothetical protein
MLVGKPEVVIYSRENGEGNARYDIYDSRNSFTMDRLLTRKLGEMPFRYR